MSKLELGEVRPLALRNTSASLPLGPCVSLHNPTGVPQVSGIGSLSSNQAWVVAQNITPYVDMGGGKTGREAGGEETRGG